MSQAKRAPFQKDLQELRDRLPALLPLLEAQEGWYGSIYFERKSSKTYMANLRQTQVSDQSTTGLVMRIYDGYTLYEQATDDLDYQALPELARRFAARVAQTPPAAGVEGRPYQPASWKERLSEKLDSEITSQVPAGVTAQSRVHFGIRLERDPLGPSTEENLSRLKSVVGRCLELAPAQGLKTTDLTYVMSRMGIADEESIFIDRESNLSQRLYRVSLLALLMSGADRVLVRVGGLGGLESIELADSEIVSLLQDLKALKSAERLTPGSYKILLGPGTTGVLAHEAFGHSQEGDTCARGRSKAWELYLEHEKGSGKPVGNRFATILNNPAVYHHGEQTWAAWGSYFFDEEGWLAREQVLLDEGTLKAPMTNLTSALRLGVPRTANGKRESWANGVYTRQTNTYFSAGESTLAELMSQIDSGFLATEVAGGMEDPKGMGIQVGLAYVKEVKNGKLTGRVFKGPAGGDIQLTGYVPEVLAAIVGKSKIEAESEGPDESQHPLNDVGGCGKYHKEFVHAGCGGPYLLLDGVTLG